MSSKKIIPVASIAKKGHRLSFVVAVRVLRAWAVSLYNEPKGLEMILLDSEGSRIVATIRQDISNDFQALLPEGEIRMITGFKVLDYSSKVARINHPYKIEFGVATEVSEPEEEFHIPRNGFQFVRFSTVTVVDPQFTLDVVGTYCSHGDIEHIPAAKARKLDVTLKDKEGRELVAIMWESYADELLAFLQSRVEDDPPFNVALQFVSISKYMNVFRVQTMRNKTVLILDPDNEEITAFLSSGQEDSLIVNSDDTMATKPADWFINQSTITIKDLFACTEAGMHTIVAEVSDIDTSNWYYEVCSKCKKKPTKGPKKQTSKVGDTCAHCLQVIEGLIPRYRLRLETQDDKEESAFFILLDKQPRAYLGKSAADIIAKVGPKGKTRGEFKKFFGKDFIFKIQVQQDYNIDQQKQEYTIIELSDDQDFISQFVKEKSNVSSGDVIEETSSNTIIICDLTPKKRNNSDILDGCEQKSRVEGNSATKVLKIPKKEKI